jgi:valyl-tRNA synthetase
MPTSTPSTAAALSPDTLDKAYDPATHEAACLALWETEGTYKFDPASSNPLYTIDTPPPYVSAAHLHVGHAMSYTQAEFLIRYKRMQGFNVFYPMGFDDNGLPTERFVEKTYNINKSKTTRSEFRALCLEETRKGAGLYEELWRALGLSVDWTYKYSTINDQCRRTAQWSFVDLYSKGKLYRSDEPVLWDTQFQTAQAQADLETLPRKGQLHDIAFKAPDGSALVIATTRPELIPACVGLFCHPEDARYTDLIGKVATVPLGEGRTVTIYADESVDPAFGTGLMMCCTFGDGEDVAKWKAHGLDTRVILTPNGQLNELAGPYAGLRVEEARKKIVEDLKTAELLLASKTVEQNVSVSERSGQPVEFMMVPQWFIRLLDHKEEFLKRSEELTWHPAHMKVRLDDWIKGLKYDWNISRQRFYGVPIPVWFCQDCGEVILPTQAQLPVDPTEDPCPVEVCPKCGGRHFVGETDVMDTWMTSSLTPMINANWADAPNLPERAPKEAMYPASLRVQAFEIIRSWLFYTVVKGHFHTDSLPWKQVMISGWGLNENGKKISKRDLEQYTDKDGYNRYEPYGVIRKFGADSLRYWASVGGLGTDVRYSERDVTRGHKLVVKLWNAARFCLMQWETTEKYTGFNPAAERPAMADRTPEDRWVLNELAALIPTMTQAFDGYDYAGAREAMDRFFWMTFCDTYLELVKERFWNPEQYSDASRLSAQATLWEVFRVILGLWAPFVPFVTEALYQAIYRPSEQTSSLHATAWPVAEALWAQPVPEMTVLLAVLRAVRGQRTVANISQGKRLPALVLDMAGLPEADQATLRAMELSVLSLARVETLRFGSAEGVTEVDGLRVGLVVE